ncbi:hypothetical protein H5S42_23465 [Escherichia coli]|nr:hypothetical protein [Escherichia coli]
MVNYRLISLALTQVKRENPPVETVAWKDAVDWVLEEACLAVKASSGKDA